MMEQHSYANVTNPAHPPPPELHETNLIGNRDEQWNSEDVGDGPRKRRKSEGPGSPGMSVSCELCKQRKVKCDRNQPCGWCARNSQRCEYRERKKPGLRAGYGRELEQRLDRLEGIIQTHSRLLEDVLHNSEQSRSQIHDGSPLTLSLDATRYTQTPGVYPDAPRNQNVQTTAGQYEGSQRTAQAHTFQDYQSDGNAAVQSSNIDIFGAVQSSSYPQDQSMPPYDLLYALTDLFFKHVNTWCPMLNRRTTLDALCGPSSLDEADRILLHAMVAVTLRFSTDRRLDTECRQHYRHTSKQKVLAYGIENTSVKALQALLILALDSFGSSYGSPPKNLLALITRSAMQLGLTVESNSAHLSSQPLSTFSPTNMALPEPKSWIEDESRRRLFWMVYLLDRYAAIATGTDFGLQEQDIYRTLPCRDDLFSRNQPVETRWFQTHETAHFTLNKAENLGSFSYYVEILGILSGIHEFLIVSVDLGLPSDVQLWQRKFRDLDRNLEAWKGRLPVEYGSMTRLFGPTSNNKIVNCGWIMLQATYHTTVIRLHSAAAYPTIKSSIFAPSHLASTKSIAAVKSIIALGQYVVENGILSKLGPPFAFTLWVAACLLLVHSSATGSMLDSDIQFFLATLREMGKVVQAAERYRTILQHLLDSDNVSKQSATAAGEHMTTSNLKTMSEMRRYAYDLSIHSSRHKTFEHSSEDMSKPGQLISAINETECLEAFEFFNVPKAPITLSAPSNGSIDPSLQPTQIESISSQVNLASFVVDRNSDWLSQDDI